VNGGVIDTIAHYCMNRPSPMCHALIEHQLGGALRRIGHDETAFNHQDLEYSFRAWPVR
jgi:hypothetical protein